MMQWPMTSECPRPNGLTDVPFLDCGGTTPLFRRNSHFHGVWTVDRAAKAESCLRSPYSVTRSMHRQRMSIGHWSLVILWSLVIGHWPFSLCAAAAPSDPLVTSWLAAQTNLHTWSADVTQTRSLKTLAQPLVAQGRVWFSAPNLFRWEILAPSQTIAVRQTNELLVIYPKLKRAERYPLTGNQAGPWKDALALLEAGFPRSRAELDARFKILSQSVSNEACELTLQPTVASARRLMPQIKIAFGTNDFVLRSTELRFADGSTMRNDFSNAKLNPPLAPILFLPAPDADVKVVEPLKKSGN